MTIRIGMGQLLVEGGEPHRNLERAERMAQRAVQAGCDILLLPETIDFAWTHPSAFEEAEPIPGPFSEIFRSMARDHGLMVCVGLTRRHVDGGRTNTALLIDRDGEILLTYDKINLLEVEFPFYDVGRRLGVVQTRFGPIGVNICADNYLDGLHIGHTLARMGAGIILSPSSWTVEHSITEEEDPYTEKWIRPLSLLARAHGIVVVSTTSVGYIVGGPYEGKKMVGKSLAVGPDGVLKEGVFNEFAGVLETVEFEVPVPARRGVQIGEHLKRNGYNTH